MSKKEKAAFALAEDIQTVIAAIPKLEALIKAHKEIASGYQKYRKNGGEAIAGIEKHLAVSKPKKPVEKKTKAAAPATEIKEPKAAKSVKKAGKKTKK